MRRKLYNFGFLQRDNVFISLNESIGVIKPGVTDQQRETNLSVCSYSLEYIFSY